MRPLPGEDIWRSVDLLRDLVNDIHRRVRSLEERQPPQRTEVARPGDDFHVGTVVCRVDNPSVVGEVIGFVTLSDGPNLRVKVLNEDAKWKQMYWPEGSCRFAATPDPTPANTSVASLSEVENLRAREEVLIALVRRAANEIRDGQARRDLLADLEALLAEKTL
ncbi:MAG: hypothetical protein ACRCSL_16780 [Microbacterium sp.]